jgi:hypothetical protein
MKPDHEILSIRDECLENIDQRKSVYNFYLSEYEDENCENLLKAHLDEVVSLIYMSENVIFDLKKNTEDDILNPKEEKFRNIIQDRFYSDSLDLRFYDEVLCSLIFGNQFLKIYPTGKRVEVETVLPYELGVRYTTIPEINDPSQAVCHIKLIPLDVLRSQYSPELIDSAIVSENATGFEDILTQPLMVYGSNKGSFFGPTYKNEIRSIMRQKTSAKFVQVEELWVYEDDIPDKSSPDDKTMSDYMVYTIINNTVINRGVNPCVEKRLPFVNINLNSMSKNFWGMSELYYLVYLQNEITKNQRRGDDVMSLLANPSMIFSGLLSSGVPEDIMEKLKTPGAMIDIPGEDIKMEPYVPKLDPSMAYQVKGFYEQAFEKISGLNETLAGRASTNVRTAGQQSLLASFASAPLKKKALKLENAIEETMLLYAQSYQIIHADEYGEIENYRIKVNSHSTSPITQFQYMNVLFQLFGSGVVPPELLVKLVPIPRQSDVLKYLKQKEAAQAELFKEHPELVVEQAEAQFKGVPRGGKKK